MGELDHRVHNRERVFEGTKFAVDVVDLVGRSGDTLHREIVVHSGAVVILALTADEELVLIRNQRFAVGKEIYELPAGTLEAGEDPADCAGRELLEETGYRADTIKQLTSFYTTPGICNERMHAFLATGLHHEGQQLEDGEHITVETIPRKRVLEMIQNGEIEDAKTIAMILFQQLFTEK
ncbi:MAG: NUDIX hydrolase [Phycisphaeraceae bacterium]